MPDDFDKSEDSKRNFNNTTSIPNHQRLIEIEEKRKKRRNRK